VLLAGVRTIGIAAADISGGIASRLGGIAAGVATVAVVGFVCTPAAIACGVAAAGLLGIDYLNDFTALRGLGSSIANVFTVKGDTADFYAVSSLAGGLVSVGRTGLPSVIATLRAGFAKLFVPRSGIDLALRYKPDWTAAQRAAADAKAAALSKADTVVSRVQRSGTSAASRYKRAGGVVPSRSDVDHTIDLQLGGCDVLCNLSPLDLSVNRSMGSQIQQLIKGFDVGTRINRVTIGD
jgi:hypothetical protein